ncbi:unnamed protein product [Phyllotreta striolata]|uniref:SET domain-containing protein n=1 Tax=Phyllotreta striolata TaxID=444603 RepID=A0A9N9TFF0_PHYSR|nr:unnamed protein product [Phyllotreta striolata]
MSVCFEPSNSLAAVSAAPETSLEDNNAINRQNVASSAVEKAPDQPLPNAKSIAKLVVATANSQPSTVGGSVLQKVANPPLITVLNPSGPLTVVKTLCVTSGASSAPQFTFVNSAPLSVTNAIGKSPTITLLNAPVTVVKAIATAVEKGAVQEAATGGANSPVATAVIENRGHNVFVKNTQSESIDMPQSHKLLTANNFPSSNILSNPQGKTLNGQRNKLKIVSSNIMVAGSSQSQLPNNIIMNNKPAQQQRYVPRPRVLGTNRTTTKYIKQPNVGNFMKPSVNPQMKLVQDKPPARLVYPTHKGQIKTMPPVNSFAPKQQQQQHLQQTKHAVGAASLSRSAAATRGVGLRTIPAQKAHNKVPNKLNYIGKHAVQAQKLRQTHKLNKQKGTAGAVNAVPYNVHVPPMMPDKQLNELTFNQALTAQIIETLSNSGSPSQNNRYEGTPSSRYDSAFTCPDVKSNGESCKPVDDSNKSGLDALSLICQAVLLDHNYNATLPPDSPTRPSPPLIVPGQVNGLSAPSIYSPGSLKRRQLSSSSNVAASPAVVNHPPLGSGVNNNLLRDDDNASDISDGSERKHDTEGEETDTAPEAEAVNNDNFDGYGDYITRCICGFLHDDGYMVECDRCKVWQHVQCVVKNRQVPDEFLCEECDPSKVIDRPKARAVQQQWLRDRQLVDPKLRGAGSAASASAASSASAGPKIKEAFKPKEMPSDTDSSDAERPPNNFVAKQRTLTKRKADGHPKHSLARQRRENAKEAVQKRQKRKERKVIRKKTRVQPKNHSDDENQDTWSSHLPQLRQWIEKYEEAVTNHYSPELRARMSSIRSNGAHSDAATARYDPSVHKCRVHTQPLTELKYLVATADLPPDTPVVELRGKYMLSTQHRAAAGAGLGAALTTRQHSQRPGPFLFFYRLHKDNTEVCVDTRTYGNAARFVRRSCRPNAELRHCIEKGALHIYVVSTGHVERNGELTIKHESHDLAAIGTTSIACACGNLDECSVNKSSIKKNGDALETRPGRKRRRRRIVSPAQPDVDLPKIPKEPAQASVAAPLPSPSLSPLKVKPEKQEEIETEAIEETRSGAPDPVEIKKEEIKEEVKCDVVMKEEEASIKREIEEEEEAASCEENKEKRDDDEAKSPSPTPVLTRRSSHKSDKDEEKVSTKPDKKDKSKKLSREERKLEAILRAIEQMEKAESKKQEHQAKQQHRRESEPNPNNKDDDGKEPKEPRSKRRRRKGRARTVSQSAARRNRLNSTDSYMTTSGDENLLSPNGEGVAAPPPPALRHRHSTKEHRDASDDRAAGLLLALSNGDNDGKEPKSPPPAREGDSNSNSAHSSPETQLSSACLLVQAAVEPLEQGFKFPKTKKGLMNEWLNKTPEAVQAGDATGQFATGQQQQQAHNNNPVELDSGGGFAAKNLSQMMSYCEVQQARGSAKKRWLRQAISEDHSCDSPSSRPDSPPISDMVAPPKKRRLPRESLSTDNSPPSTPTGPTPPLLNNFDKNSEGSVEIVYTTTGGDSPNQSLESDAVLRERAAKMKQEFSGKPLFTSTARQDLGSSIACLDPRLARDNRFLGTSDLVGTVEKTLSILGLDNNAKPEPTPKRKVKLSITEYRQRKKLNVEEKSDEQETEAVGMEENNSSESFKTTTPTPRPRSASATSDTSATSSDDEVNTPEILVKAPVFNSEPTELERQRETSSLRLKKAFGLAIDKEPPALNIKAILNLELEPTKGPSKGLPLASPTFPIPGAADSTTKEAAPASPEGGGDCPPPSEEAEMETIADVEEEPKAAETALRLFYTPDEEEAAAAAREEDDDDVVAATEESVGSVGFEETESISYVPPFNNPVYPNSSFAAFSSAIDDDARYEGRNPSPPPNLDEIAQS